MAKRRRVYEPRVFDGRIIMPDEIERIWSTNVGGHGEGVEKIPALQGPGLKTATLKQYGLDQH